jgi:hypothetical protein
LVYLNKKMQNDKEHGSRIEEGELGFLYCFIETNRCKMIKKTAAGSRKGSSVFCSASLKQTEAK